MNAVGYIEVIGLTAAIEAADVACKTAAVDLVGYQLTKGGGMVTIIVTGAVGAVKASIEAAEEAAEQISRVVSVLVIPRPASDVEKLINTPATKGYTAPAEKSDETAALQPERETEASDAQSDNADVKLDGKTEAESGDAPEPPIKLTKAKPNSVSRQPARRTRARSVAS